MNVGPYFSVFFLTKSLNRLVNSIGKIYLVEGPQAMLLSVSKYCKVMVF